MANNLPFEIRHIPPFTNEWPQLSIAVYSDLVDQGLYTPEEVEAISWASARR